MIDTRPKDAYAALRSRASSDAARSFVNHLTLAALTEEQSSGLRKYRRGFEKAQGLSEAIERIVGDLLSTNANPRLSGRVWRPLKATGFTGDNAPVSFRHFKSAAAALVALGFAERLTGKGRFIDFDGHHQLDGTATRFWATPKLLDLAEACGVSVTAIDEHFRQEPLKSLLVLKRASVRVYYQKTRGRSVPFTPNERTEQLAAQVAAINDFVGGVNVGGAPHPTFYRVFNEYQPGSEYGWDKGGRLFAETPLSGNKPYQQLGQEHRGRMTINGEAVAEVDIRACNLTLLHAKLHLPFDPTTDPYERAGVEREVAKKWVVFSFGAHRPIERWPQNLGEDDRAQIGEHKASTIKSKMVKAFPALEMIGKPGATWADLMFSESQAVIGAMTALMRIHGIPSLPVHDSLIVPTSRVRVTADALQDSFYGQIGVYPWLAVKTDDVGVREAVAQSLTSRRQVSGLDL